MGLIHWVINFGCTQPLRASIRFSNPVQVRAPYSQSCSPVSALTHHAGPFGSGMPAFEILVSWPDLTLCRYITDIIQLKQQLFQYQNVKSYNPENDPYKLTDAV